MRHKKLLVFPILSAIFCLFIIATFVLGLRDTGHLQLPEYSVIPPIQQQVVFYRVAFIVYFLSTMVIVFFNSALIACAALCMEGKDPTIGQGVQAALERLPAIILWALLSATVGLTLRVLEQGSRGVKGVFVAVLGVGWSLLSYFVIPFMMFQDKGPIQALKESKELLRKTWGEQLIGLASFGFIAFLFGIPGVIVLVLFGAFSSFQGVVVTLSLTLSYICLVVLIQSALQAIFQVALYRYAHDGTFPSEFSPEAVKNAIVSSVQSRGVR